MAPKLMRLLIMSPSKMRSTHEIASGTIQADSNLVGRVSREATFTSLYRRPCHFSNHHSTVAHDASQTSFRLVTSSQREIIANVFYLQLYHRDKR